MHSTTQVCLGVRKCCALTPGDARFCFLSKSRRKTGAKGQALPSQTQYFQSQAVAWLRLRPMRSNVDDLFEAVDTDEDNTINLEELLGRMADD